jgi:aminoglycoside 2'-N-acetyltransferase I
MTAGFRLLVAHTADLTPAGLRAVRGLLDQAFEGDFDDTDWDHCLGGLHVLVHDGGDGGSGDGGTEGVGGTGPVAHGAVVQRRVLHAGRSLRTGYVEGVAVRADRRRRGLGGELMAVLERVIDAAYPVGALSATSEGAGLYASRGWRVWPGRIQTLGPGGPLPLPEEEGSLYVRPGGGTVLDPAQALVFDWRDGDIL